MKIKLHVSTGWSGGDHVDYIDLPANWSEFTDEEKEKYLDGCAIEYLYEKCESSASIVDEEE